MVERKTSERVNSESFVDKIRDLGEWLIVVVVVVVVYGHCRSPDLCHFDAHGGSQPLSPLPRHWS